MVHCISRGCCCFVQQNIQSAINSIVFVVTTLQTSYFIFFIRRMRSSHRKSHSTSVLSFLAGSPASTSQLSLEQNAPRQQHRSKRGQSVLPSVDEQLSNTSNNILSGLQEMMDDRQKDDHPGDRLKRGRGRGDAKQLLSDVSTFYLISSQ